MNRLSDLHPRRAVTPGRYILDRFGRLYPTSAPIRPVAFVVVKARNPVVLDQPASPPKPAAKLDGGAVLSPDKTGSEVFRSTARRAEPARVVVPADVLPVADEAEEAHDAFKAIVARRQIARAKATPPAPRLDGKRLAAAIRSRPAPEAPKPKAPPTEYAHSREECHLCGIPGFKGCEHFLPFDASRT